MTLEIVKIILTVISLLFAGVQVYFLTYNIKANKKWNAQDAAFKFCLEYIDLLNDISIPLKMSLNLISEVELNESSAYYVELFNPNTADGLKNREEIKKIIRYYERLSVGILCDYFDEEIVRRSMNRTFIITYKNLRPYILMRRGETQSNICTHFERVAETWMNTPLNYSRRDTPSKRKK